ncbi:Uncharacterised protein [Mycobacterium tuberculosis]|nr:Uncharacterised protein [Mycobacterium tuberculosis]
MQEVFIEDLPLSGFDDVQVMLAIRVGYLLIEEVVVGVPDQPAVRNLGCSFQGRIGHQKAAVEILGVNQDVGVVEDPIEYPLPFAQRGQLG